MKIMGKFYMKSMQTMRKITAMMAMMLVAVAANAFTSTYYYSANAYVAPTGAGKVYVSDNQTNNPNYQTSSSISTTSYRSVGQPTVNLYFYASANEGYLFQGWASTANGSILSTSNPYNVSQRITSENQNSPTNVTRYAIFQEQTGLVKVYSESASRGTVDINNVDNALGDEVVLTATPDAANGVHFLGWKYGSLDAEDYVSTDNPYTFTVTTENEGNYYACFSAAQEQVYVRIKNRHTGRYLSVYGNTHAQAHNRTMSNETRQDGFIFNSGLKMISADEAQGNPTTVFRRNGNPGGHGLTYNVDLYAQTVSFTNNLTDQSHKLVFDEYSDEDGKYYTIVTVMDLGSNVSVSSYLTDEGTDWAVMKSYANDDEYDSATEWEVYVLDEDEVNGQFGANAKARYTQNDMYYTTMYTDFPYKVLDGVKAYYLAADESSYQEGSNTIIFTEIESGIVPANTPVILECTEVQNAASVAEVKNRLLPLINVEVEPIVNLLSGYISVNGNRIANNQQYMYILTMNTQNILGFYHTANQYMTPNKAYLDASAAQEAINSQNAKNVRLSFGDPEDEATTIITLSQILGESGAPVYDIMGRKVAESSDDMNNLPKGIYITNGKKYIIK